MAHTLKRKKALRRTSTVEKLAGARKKPSDAYRMQRLLQIRTTMSALQGHWKGASAAIAPELVAALDHEYSKWCRFRLPWVELPPDVAAPLSRDLCHAWLTEVLLHGDARGSERERWQAHFSRLRSQVRAEPPLSGVALLRFDRVCPRLDQCRTISLGHATIDREHDDEPHVLWELLQDKLPKGDGIQLAYFSGADMRRGSPRFAAPTGHYVAFSRSADHVEYLDPVLGCFAFHGADTAVFVEFFTALHQAHKGQYQRVDLVRYMLKPPGAGRRGA